MQAPLRQIRRLLPQITKIHRFLYEKTDGRIGHRARGFRFLLLETIGRKSGLSRKTPILYVDDSRDGLRRFVLAASNAGQDKSPAWWLNLQAQPLARIQVGRKRWAVRAREASAKESERLWPMLTASWPWFDDYREASARKIPVVILEPREESAGSSL